MHYFPARIDLLHKLEEERGKQVYHWIGHNPFPWLEELTFLSAGLDQGGTTSGLGGIQLESNADLQQLGPNGYLCRKGRNDQRGLWVRESEDGQDVWTRARNKSASMARHAQAHNRRAGREHFGSRVQAWLCKKRL
jgi:hypothetical protein